MRCERTQTRPRTPWQRPVNGDMSFQLSCPWACNSIFEDNAPEAFGLHAGNVSGEDHRRMSVIVHNGKQATLSRVKPYNRVGHSS